ncbi:MAG: hypothetical protein K5919_09050 [Clostridiales bacterium]|nr:hypothetical protein [Clostridiales bacterium]
MATEYFMDEKTLALGNTLLTLQCDGPIFTVPAEFGGLSVTTVGSGALQLRTVQELTFAPGYKELKEKCLCYTATLERMNVPETVQRISSALFAATNGKADLVLSIDRALQPSTFLDMRRMMLQTEEKQRLLPPSLLQRGEMELVRCLMCNSAPSAAIIRKDMRLLFSGRLPGDEHHEFYSGTVFDPRPCFDFLSGRKKTEEYTAVMEMIRADDPGWHDPEAERKGDLNLRFGASPVAVTACKKVSVVLCPELPNAPGPDGLFHAQFHLFRRHLFFPALRHIRHQGADWWIYSRNYLTSDPERPYLREDVGVFDRNGLVTDRKSSEDVYAKYRFLALL